MTDIGVQTPEVPRSGPQWSRNLISPVLARSGKLGGAAETPVQSTLLLLMAAETPADDL